MAINICRADRKSANFFNKGGTDESVAPGSYDTPRSCINVVGERPVPFASGVDKVCCPNLSTSGYTPGPGHYMGQIKSHEEASSLGPVNFRSKTARIGPTSPGSTAYTESTIWKNPGPGQYGTSSEWELALKKPPRNAANPWREAPDKTVPSIPLQKLPPGATPENAMGSDITNVTMRHTGETRDTAGPGEYDPDVALTTRSHPQTSFKGGGPRKDRNLWETGASSEKPSSKEPPGPGSYNSKPGIGEAAGPDAEKSSTYQFASKTVLPHQKEAGDKVAPGPGRYDAPGQIDKLSARARAHSSTHGDRTRFGSAVQRIGWSRPVDMPFVDPYHIHNVPGPGSYPTTVGTFPSPAKEKEKEAAKAIPGNKKKKFHGVHHPMIVMALQETEGPLEAFGSTDDRSCNKVQQQTTPAPWAYNKDEARGYSMAAELREKSKVGRNGAFGSLADRFFGSPLQGNDDIPDGGMEGGAEEKIITSGAYSEPRSAFHSQTPRMQAAPCSGEPHAVMVGHFETPAPGTYSIDHEPNYRSQFRFPRSDHLSFGSGQSRFDIGRDIFDGHSKGMSNPSPGDYEGTLGGPIRGAAEMKDKRKLGPPIGCTTKDVGPGSYGTIDTPMLKKTFNVSTQAPASLNSARRRPQRQDNAF